MNPLIERFELINLLGKFCLFTSLRVKRADLPDGLYKYDLREGERNFFGSLEHGVLINHMGTVISKEPIDLGDAGYIGLKDETQPNFLDEMMTINEYMGATPEMIRCRHAERDW